MNTICKEVKIIPTNEVGSEGYKEAVLYAGEEGTIIDSFGIKGNVRIDFETEKMALGFGRLMVNFTFMVVMV